ncbi:DUF342 domain-containing protein [Haliovirga abyssi]|uniref:Flagellar Assembly Protein A N-terminal region domain-containing protein n=1 Tax=Haliovirga abyssi TaxID=2996794 RepID=A0AAU9DK35_9FUSO|nr:FapA family protein [Haliovirga abyssi]BDU50232.1 hypothetical protein HLVA_08010 [Haliovirga abyssi]
MKKYLVKGNNKGEVLEKVSKHFKTKIENVKYEILNEKKGLFGKVKEIEMRVWVEELEEKASNKKNAVKKDKNKEKKSEEPNKFFEIKILKSGIYLNVKSEFLEYGLDQSVLMDELAMREIKNPDVESILEAVSSKNNEFVKIAEYDPEYYIDANVKVDILKKGMKAVVNVSPPNRGNHVTYEKIISELKLKGIIFGVNDNEIKKISKEKIYNQDILLAEGKQPENGEDAKIIYLFDTDTEINISKDEKGNVDYKELDIIQNVTKGQVLARKVPATNGEPGMNILGEIVPPKKGKDKKLPKGKNTLIGESEEYLVAEKDGYVSLVGNLITVSDVFIINENVDYSTGNISFNGTVFVKGNVIDGFKVEANYDIIVNGIVENSYLESKGNVSVKNGIIGKEEGIGKVIAEGNIKSKFIENGEIISGGMVFANNILYSKVNAKDTINVTSKKGKIIGGKIVAGREVIARVIGSKMGGAVTEVEVGVFPEYRERLKEIENDLLKKLKEREKNTVELNTLKKLKENNKLPDDKNKLLLQRTKQQFVYAKDIFSLEKEKEKLKEILKKGKNGKIHVLDEIYEGTIIRIGDHQLLIKDSFKYVTFYVDIERDEIAILPCEV